MKSPFRVLRRKLFVEGKLLSYIGYAVGEVLLIIIGILIALKIADWNDYRNDRSEEALYLGLILDDLEQSIIDQEGAIENYDERNKYIQHAIALLYEQNLNEDNYEEFCRNYLKMIGWPIFPMGFDTLDELFSTGKFTLITDRPIRRELSRFVDLVERRKKDSEFLDLKKRDTAQSLGTYIRFAPTTTGKGAVIVSSFEELNSNELIYNWANSNARRHKANLIKWQELHAQTKAMRDTLKEYIENH